MFLSSTRNSELKMARASNEGSTLVTLFREFYAEVIKRENTGGGTVISSGCGADWKLRDDSAAIQLRKDMWLDGATLDEPCPEGIRLARHVLRAGSTLDFFEQQYGAIISVSTSASGGAPSKDGQQEHDEDGAKLANEHEFLRACVDEITILDDAFTRKCTATNHTRANTITSQTHGFEYEGTCDPDKGSSLMCLFRDFHDADLAKKRTMRFLGIHEGNGSDELTREFDDDIRRHKEKWLVGDLCSEYGTVFRGSVSTLIIDRAKYTLRYFKGLLDLENDKLGGMGCVGGDKWRQDVANLEKMKNELAALERYVKEVVDEHIESDRESPDAELACDDGSPVAKRARKDSGEPGERHPIGGHPLP